MLYDLADEAWLPLNVTITVVIPFQMIQLSIQLLHG